MKKVIDHGTLGVTKYDTCAVPKGFKAELNCDGSDDDMKATQSEEQFFDGF